MKLSVYDGARWVSISPHAFSHAIGGKDELTPEDIGAASTLFVEDAIATHLAAIDPHSQYLTQSEGDTLYAGADAIANHLAAIDPHSQYLTQSEGDTLYAGADAIATHLAAVDPHPQYLTQSEGDTLYAGANAIASHLATTNPHQITLTLIGAAAATHTHAENRHIILPYRMEKLTTQTRINFNFSLLDTSYCGYLLNCVVGGHIGGFGNFLCKREIFLNRTISNLNFEIISSLDRGNFSGIFAFSTTPTSIKITINNMSSTQRQDFGIYCEIVGSGADLAYPVISEINYA